MRTSTQHEKRTTIALLPWGNVIEEFLDTLGISLETFCNEFRGSWFFNYVDALSTADVRTVIVCISARIVVPQRFIHRPTGATICILPVSRAYRILSRRMTNPYGRTVEKAFGELSGMSRLLMPLLALVREGVLYLTTPLKSLATQLRRESCEAILCQEYEYPRFDVCVFLGRLLKLPVFATFQGGDSQRSHLERVVRPLSLRLSHGLIVGTQSEIDRIRDYYGKAAPKVTQIFNPIDLNQWHPERRGRARAALQLPDDARIVAWHGRVSVWQKGLDILLEAWGQICQIKPKGRDFRLLMVGTGADAEELRRRLVRADLTGVIWVNEFINDPERVRRYLCAADAYVFPSRHEGFPVAPIEAMACGLPVVAAAAQGIPDILVGGETSGGIVVPCENARELARALERVLSDADLSLTLGSRARTRIEAAFSLTEVGQRLRDFMFENATYETAVHN